MSSITVWALVTVRWTIPLQLPLTIRKVDNADQVISTQMELLNVCMKESMLTEFILVLSSLFSYIYYCYFQIGLS